MTPIAIDSETFLMRRGKQAPELVCVSAAQHVDGQHIAYVNDAADGIELVGTALQHSHNLIVGQNFAFDASVFASADPSLFPLIFDAYRNDRITDTMLREKLINLADGKLKQPDVKLSSGNVSGYSLAALVHKRFGLDRSADKTGDAWRYRYHELANVPLSDWPPEAIEYPKQDARDTFAVWANQEHTSAAILGDQYRQARKAFALRLMECHGLRTDSEMVEHAERAATTQSQFIDRLLTDAGIMRADGSVNQAKLHERIIGAYSSKEGGTFASVPRTPTGKPKTDYDTLAESGDQLLEDFANAGEYRDFLTDWMPRLRQGTEGPFHTRYNTLQENGRTSSSPNVQNPPRESVLPIRECFIPRPGYVFCSVDMNSYESCSTAQTALWFTGRSELARALHANIDPHCMLGAAIEGTPYESFKARYDSGDATAKKLRQMSKPGNFGFSGGMGAEKMVAYAKAQFGVAISVGDARRLKAAWLKTWPEMNDYFRAIKAYFGRDERKPITQFVSGRIRGGVWYTAACNGYFSALANDAMGEALFNVAYECYACPNSPLYGSRPVVFPHDEIIAEVPVDGAHEAGYRLSQVMNETIQAWMPDVPITSEPALMERWYKQAKTVHDANGRLIPWRPKAT